jgi:carbamoyltransferase
MNTSFNLRGEPIVNTPREAFSTFSRSGLDALVLDHTIIVKSGS